MHRARPEGRVDPETSGGNMDCNVCTPMFDQHIQLRHDLADEQASGQPACGCDPRQHDTTGPCLRAQLHTGPCVGRYVGEPYPDDADGTPQPTPEIVQFACRADDGEPHPTTVEAILGGR